MLEKERIQIFIDGGNFHHLALKKLRAEEQSFNFEKFAEFLANGRVITERGKRFYVGTVRERADDERSKTAMSKQTALFNVLKSTRWEIKTSKLRTRTERITVDDRVAGYQELLKKGVKEIVFQRTREKGIDVKLAIDLVVGAADNQYDTAVVVSSDGDLIPAIDWIRKRQNKKVEYIGFSIIDQTDRRNDTKAAQGLITNSDIHRILIASYLQQFITSTSSTI